MFKVLENFYSNHTQPNCNFKPMNLGNNLYHTQYNPESYKKVDVVFQPMNQIKATSYIALIEEEEVVHIDANLLPSSDIELPVGVISPEVSTDDDSSKKSNTFSVGDDVVNNFFVGSITVVGLFILFSFLQKHNK